MNHCQCLCVSLLSPVQKYHSKSERRTEYTSSDNQYTPLRSPNGNVSSHGHGTHASHSSHGHHHYSHVADDRGYTTSRNAYMQKGSEKERDRDYKSSRNKYTGKKRTLCSQSKFWLYSFHENLFFTVFSTCKCSLKIKRKRRSIHFAGCIWIICILLAIIDFMI